MHIPNTRFSKDLDFSCQQHPDQTLLIDDLIYEFVEQQARVKQFFSSKMFGGVPRSRMRVKCKANLQYADTSDLHLLLPSSLFRYCL